MREAVGIAASVAAIRVSSGSMLCVVGVDAGAVAVPHATSQIVIIATNDFFTFPFILQTASLASGS
jgi:hypothetical protein